MPHHFLIIEVNSSCYLNQTYYPTPNNAYTTSIHKELENNNHSLLGIKLIRAMEYAEARIYMRVWTKILTIDIILMSDSTGYQGTS